VGNFAIDARRDLERVEKRIDQEFIKKEEVGYMFRETLTAVMSNYQKEKIDVFRAIFVNSLLNANIQAEIKELYLNIAKNLTVSHIKLLKLLDDPQQYLQGKGLTYQGSDSGGSLIQILTSCLPELSKDQIRAVWNDLHNYNMVNTEAQILGAGISSTRLEQLRGRLTPFAQEFIAFIKNPEHTYG